MSSPITAAFRAEMAAAGLVTNSDLVADGRLHRVHLDGDRPGTRNGWYVLHLDRWPGGAFGSWKLGVSRKWSAAGRQLCQDEFDRLRAKIDAGRLLEASRLREQHRAAAEVAAAIIAQAVPAPADHLYLLRKRIKPHAARVGLWAPRGIAGALLLPLVDDEGRVCNVQAIFPRADPTLGRDRDFLRGARLKGVFHDIGTITCPVGTFLICEGFATGATLHEQTGHPVRCAMSAGNLLAVAEHTRRRWPGADVVIAGDNDRHTPGNPGVTKAREAALAVGARLALPEFRSDEDGSDFNDLALRRGVG